jgi:hypothetical protein
VAALKGTSPLSTSVARRVVSLKDYEIRDLSRLDASDAFRLMQLSRSKVGLRKWSLAARQWQAARAKADSLLVLRR